MVSLQNAFFCIGLEQQTLFQISIQWINLGENIIVDKPSGGTFFSSVDFLLFEDVFESINNVGCSSCNKTRKDFVIVNQPFESLNRSINLYLRVVAINSNNDASTMFTPKLSRNEIRKSPLDLGLSFFENGLV